VLLEDGFRVSHFPLCAREAYRGEIRMGHRMASDFVALGKSAAQSSQFVTLLMTRYMLPTRPRS